MDGDFIPADEADVDGLRFERDLDLKGINHPEYALIINNDTTIRDIKKAWPLIQKLMVRDRKRKKRPWKYFWRDHTIYNLSRKGYRHEEIGTIISKKYGVLDPGHIKKTVSEFRSKIGIAKKRNT